MCPAQGIDPPISQRAAPSLKPSVDISVWLEWNNVILLSCFIVTFYVWHSFSFMVDINFPWEIKLKKKCE